MASEKLALDMDASKQLYQRTDEAIVALRSMKEEYKNKDALYDKKEQYIYCRQKDIDDALWKLKQERGAAENVIRQAAADQVIASEVSEKAAIEKQSAEALMKSAAAAQEELGLKTSEESFIHPQSKRRKRKKWVFTNSFSFDPNKADKKMESHGN